MIKKDSYSYLMACGILCVAIISFYLPTLTYGFLLDWDDALIASNRALASFNMNFIKFAFSTTNPYWQPVNWLSLGLDKVLWHNSPAAYRLVNVILHTANSLMVVYLTTQLLPLVVTHLESKYIKTAAIFSGVIFGLHPLRVESVVWITERKDVLSATFALLSTITYVQYSYGNSTKSKVTSPLFYCLSLLTKPSAIFLPLIFMLLDWCIKKPVSFFDTRRTVFNKIHYLAISTAYAATLFAKSSVFESAASPRSIETAQTYDSFEMLIAFSRSVFFYLEKYFLPLNLNPLYPTVSRNELHSMSYIVSTTLFTVITLLLVVRCKRARILCAAWFSTILLLLPSIGSFVGSGFSFMAADRISYCMSIIPGLFLAFSMATILHNSQKLFRYAVVIIIISALTLGNITMAQSKIWSSSITFKRAFSQNVPHSSYNESIKSYLSIFSEGKCLESINRLTAATPSNIKTGSNSYSTGKELFDYILDASDMQAKTAFSDEIGFYKSFKSGNSDFSDALEIVECSYKNALVYGFNTADLHHDLGIFYVATGRDANAVEEFSKAAALEPDNSHFWYDIAMLYYTNASYKEADPYLQKLVVLMPGDSYVKNLAVRNRSLIRQN